MSRQGARKLLDDFIVLEDEFGNIYKYNKKSRIFYDEDGQEVEFEEDTLFFSDSDKYDYDGSNLNKIEFEEPEEFEEADLDVEPENFEEESEKVEEMKKTVEKPSKASKGSKKASQDFEKMSRKVEESIESFKEFENFEDTFNACISKGKTESQTYFELRRRLTMEIYKKAGVSASAAISFGHLIMTKLKLDVKYSPSIEKVIKKVINNI